MQRALEKDVQEIDALARRLAEDLERSRDADFFKRELRSLEIGPFTDFGEDPDFADPDIAELIVAMTPNAPRGRRKGKRRRR